MKFLLLSCLLAAASVSARAQVVSPGPVPVTQPAFPELVSFLNLTSAQLQSLEQIQQQKFQALQDIYKQATEKQTELNALLASPSPDPLQVGQLMIDIRKLLQEATQQEAKSFRQPALAVLNPDQVTKLPILVNALQLQNPANQAVTLDLIDAPARLVPTPLPLLPPGPALNTLVR
jgi:hypothetical protein